MSQELAFATVRELGRRLRSGEVTSVGLTEFFLERLKRVGPQFNAAVTLTEDLALAQAKQADVDLMEGRDRGPLHGIPYGAKDLLAVRGYPTTWGAEPFKDRVIDDDATAITKLRDAGAVLVAKLSMVELAGGFGYRQAHSSFTGPGRNSWNAERWSGGSSSGSASAVGAGLVPFAIGSETSGSIITPAGYNGLTGLRPTYGRVSRAGAMALSWSLDKIGPIARTADDCQIVLNVMAGPDPRDPTALSNENLSPVPRRRWKLATLTGATNAVQPEVRANFEAAVTQLATIADVQETSLPDLPYGAVVGTIISCEMAAAFEDFIRSEDVWKLTAPEDRWGGHSGLMIPAKDYINAQRVRSKIQRELADWMSDFDAVVTPTLSAVAGPIDKEFRDWARGFASTSIGTAGNAAGLPAVTIPNGFGADSLPTGLQLTGHALEEPTILAIADHFQSLTDWHGRHPDLP